VQALGVVRPATLLVSCNQAACIVRCTVPAEAHIVRCAMMVGSSRSGEAVVTKEPSPPISAIAARMAKANSPGRLGCGLGLLFFIRQPSAVTMGAMLLLLLLVVLASVETAVVVPVV
jgi:hypothetical protein